MSQRNPFFTEKRITSLLTFFQYFYLGLSILAVLVFLITLMRGQFRVDVIIPAIFAALVSYGIYNRKSWIVLLVTVLAAWGILSNLFVSPSDTFTAIFSVLFLGFEIYFFNTKAVKKHFSAHRSTALI